MFLPFKRKETCFPIGPCYISEESLQKTEHETGTAPVAMPALQDEVVFSVAAHADGAGGQARARRTLRVVVLPLAPQARTRGSAVPAPDAPESQHPRLGFTHSFSYRHSRRYMGTRGGNLFNAGWKSSLLAGSSLVHMYYYAIKHMWLIFKNEKGKVLKWKG